MKAIKYIALIFVVALGIVSLIKIDKISRRHPTIHEIVADHDDLEPRPVPIHVETQYWKTNTELFLRALWHQEKNLADNPWGFTPDYLTDCYEFHPELRGGDLSNIHHAAKLVRVYNTRHRAENDQHAAAMHFKGPSGCNVAEGQAYGQRVQDTIWDWDARGITSEGEPVDIRTYATPAPWEGVNAK